MSDAERSWWLDADRTWRRGAPPDGWRQRSDGRWHAAGGGPDRTTDELVVVAAPWTDPPELPTQDMPAVPARHLAITGDAGRRHGQPRSNAPKAVLGPTWTKVVASALAAVVLLTAAGVYVAARRTNGEPAAPADELSAPAASPPADQPATTASTDPEAAPASGDSASEGSAADPTVTTTAPPSPTTTSTPLDEPDPAAPGGPLAACSTGQRNVIERGNHPWDWYLARFDANGDGVLCN